jgi:hypothetical protein
MDSRRRRAAGSVPLVENQLVLEGAQPAGPSLPSGLPDCVACGLALVALGPVADRAEGEPAYGLPNTRE